MSHLERCRALFVLERELAQTTDSALAGFLLDACCNGGYNPKRLSVFSNGSAVCSLLMLLPKLPTAVHERVVEALNHVVTVYQSPNCHSLMTTTAWSACIPSGCDAIQYLTSFLTTVTPPPNPIGMKVLSIVENLLSYSCPVPSLFHFLNLIGSSQTSIAWAEYLSVLYTVLTHPPIVTRFWQFTSTDSGLVVRRITFPPNGYTFAFYMKLNFSGFTDDLSRNPRILVLCGQDGVSYLEVIQDSNGFLIVTRQSGGKLSSNRLQPPGGFESQKWYHVAFAHEYRMMTTSTVQLCVNGEVYGKQDCRYPASPKGDHTIYIGTDLHNRTVRGQIGSLIFYRDALSADLLPSCLPNVMNIDESSAHSQFMEVQRSHGSKVLFYLSPWNTMPNGVCVDYVEDGMDSKRTLHNGLVLGMTTTVHCLWRCRDSICTLGGVEWVLYFARRLVASDMITSDISEEEAVHLRKGLMYLLLILGELLKANTKEQNRMGVTHGFTLLGYIMEKIPAAILCPKVTQAALSLHVILEAPLLEEFYNSVILKAVIWRNTQFQSQKIIYITLVRFLTYDFCVWFRTTFGLTRVLDNISLLYKPVIKPDGICCPEMAEIRLFLFDFLVSLLTKTAPTNGVVPRVMKSRSSSAIGEHTLHSETQYIQSPHIKKCKFASCPMTPVEFDSLIQFIVCSVKPQREGSSPDRPDTTSIELVEGLQLLRELLHYTPSGLMEIVVKRGGLHVLLHPLLERTSSDLVRAEVLHCIRVFLEATMVSTTESAKIRLLCEDLEFYFHHLGSVLRRIPFSDKVYCAVRVLLVENKNRKDDSALPQDIQTFKANPAKNVPSLHLCGYVKSPYRALSCLFCMAWAATGDTRLRVLGTIGSLIYPTQSVLPGDSTTAAMSVLPALCWTRWLFDVLRFDQNNFDEDTNVMLLHCVQWLLARVLCGTTALRDSWKYLLDTLVSILPSPDETPLCAIMSPSIASKMAFHAINGMLESIDLLAGQLTHVPRRASVSAVALSGLTLDRLAVLAPIFLEDCISGLPEAISKTISVQPGNSLNGLRESYIRATLYLYDLLFRIESLTKGNKDLCGLPNDNLLSLNTPVIRSCSFLCCSLFERFASLAPCSCLNILASEGVPLNKCASFALRVLRISLVFLWSIDGDELKEFCHSDWNTSNEFIFRDRLSVKITPHEAKNPERDRVHEYRFEALMVVLQCSLNSLRDVLRDEYEVEDTTFKQSLNTRPDGTAEFTSTADYGKKIASSSVAPPPSFYSSPPVIAAKLMSPSSTQLSPRVGRILVWVLATVFHCLGRTKSKMKLKESFDECHSTEELILSFAAQILLISPTGICRYLTCVDTSHQFADLDLLQVALAPSQEVLLRYIAKLGVWPASDESLPLEAEISAKRLMAIFSHCLRSQNIEFQASDETQCRDTEFSLRRVSFEEELKRQAQEESSLLSKFYTNTESNFEKLMETENTRRKKSAIGSHDKQKLVSYKTLQLWRHGRDATCSAWWISQSKVYSMAPPFYRMKDVPPLKRMKDGHPHAKDYVSFLRTKDQFWILSDVEFEIGGPVRIRVKPWENGTRHPEAERHIETDNSNDDQLKPKDDDKLLKMLQSNFVRHTEVIKVEDEDEDEEEPNTEPALSSKFKASEDEEPSSPDTVSYENSDDYNDHGRIKSMFVMQRLRSERRLWLKNCEMIIPLATVKGRCFVTSNCLYFLISPEEDCVSPLALGGKDICIPWETVRDMRNASYCMQDICIEIIGRKSTLLKFGNPRIRVEAFKVFKKFVQGSIPFSLSSRRTPSKILAKMKATERWVRREITTFEYLLLLNRASGRTCNDLNQYPVFPWVLSDYTSKVLDLSLPDIYRDFSRPIGALTESRLQGFLLRYESMKQDSPDMPPFMYGTHYSNSAAVLFYLVRMEPYASLAAKLQGGTWDHPDRMFHSVAEAWNGCLKNTADLKELIPEFFYLPDFLINRHTLSLGIRQDGIRLGDVELPPWAKNAYQFVAIQRMALESEYVSQNIHKWIDLVWGEKQRGEKAVASFNLFYYLTYEGSVDVEAITNDIERNSVLTQISNFGQTPSQLMKKAHPPRGPRSSMAMSPMSLPMQFIRKPEALNEPCISFARESDKPCLVWITRIPSAQSFQSSVQCLACSLSGKISTFNISGTPGKPDIMPTEDKALPTGLVWKDASENQDSGAGNNHCNDTPHAYGYSCFNVAAYTKDLRLRERQGKYKVPSAVSMASKALVMTKDSKYLFSAGYNDCSIKFSSSSNPSRINFKFPSSNPFGFPDSFLEPCHRDVVTCLDLDESETYLVSGSRDCLVILWRVSNIIQGRPSSECLSSLQSYAIVGHTQPVLQVYVSTVLDIIVSSGMSNYILIHSVHTRHLTRCIAHPLARSVTAFVVSKRYYSIAILSKPNTAVDGDKGTVNYFGRSLNLETADDEKAQDFLVDVQLKPESKMYYSAALASEWAGKASLHYISLNGDVISSRPVDGSTDVLVLSVSEESILCGGSSITVHRALTLEKLHEFELPRYAVSEPSSRTSTTYVQGTNDGVVSALAVLGADEKLILSLWDGQILTCNFWNALT